MENKYDFSKCLTLDKVTEAFELYAANADESELSTIIDAASERRVQLKSEIGRLTVLELPAVNKETFSALPYLESSEEQPHIVVFKPEGWC